MPKGYWIVHVDVHNNETYAKYREANAIAFEKFGARFIVRGGEQIIEEGYCRQHQQCPQSRRKVEEIVPHTQFLTI